MKRFFLAFSTLLVLTVISSCGHGETELLSHSPDGIISVQVHLLGPENELQYSVFKGDNTIVEHSPIRIEFKDMPPLGKDLLLQKMEREQIDESWERVWGRSKQVRNRYNQTLYHLKEANPPYRDIDLVFRIYDEGVALRYHIPEQEGMETFSITNEHIAFNFSDNHQIWAAEYGYKSHQETTFDQMTLADVDQKIMGLPLLVKIRKNCWVSLTEANLTDWAGMFLSSVSDTTLVTRLAPRMDDPDVLVKSQSLRHSPWRVIMLGDSEGSFLESDILQNLNEPCALEDVSWIEPGKSAWDWWWSNSYAPEVDFTVGSNTETMKYYIDFASEMGWEYQLVDWQWYGEPFDPEGPSEKYNPTVDILTCTDEIDVPELVSYANSKNVKLLVWLQWEHAKIYMEEAFPLYEKWGVAGVKVDFMARDDQEMVNYYHDLVKLAAKHKLTVDFHGAYKPTGISRTYPNLLTREGVMGNEYNKWSPDITPEHTTTIAYTRNMLGEMDFTPGGFNNQLPENYKLEGETTSPMVLTTRAQQLAMMVVFESALQVMCDAPYVYRSSPAGLDFLELVPTTWDETRFLGGAIGEYIVVARRSGEEWFIGAMNNSQPRQVEIALDFLQRDSYQATIWKDTEETEEHPTVIGKQEKEIGLGSSLQISMASGGGQVIWLKR